MMLDTSQKSECENGGMKFKKFVGKTPGLLKSKLLNVLGSSNELLNDFSNKLDTVLTLSSSSDSGTSNNQDDDTHSRTTFDGADDELFDFEIRRVKERRAHEEVLSGKYRHPNYNMPHDIISLDDFEDISSAKTSTNSDPISDGSPLEPLPSTSCSHQSENVSSSYIQPLKFIEPSISAGSGSQIISLTDEETCTENNKCEKSDSFNTVPSTMSSLSLDSQIEDSGYEFMKKFVKILFENSGNITPELKSEFGKLAMTETGRIWFSRLINLQRVKSKRVDEMTFYALVQYFAIVLFECSEADDFTPAKNLMNMCFTFFHEVDVPGCEPYREYLYNYLREQPIWLSLRFWNAAFFDALQCERANRPIPKINDGNSKSSNNSNNSNTDKQYSSSSSTKSTSPSSLSLSSCESERDLTEELKEDQHFQQNITFGQLGTFTCNMHAFGLSKELCVDFLRKQCTIANLSRDQEKMLKDNINRMYKETDKWRD